MKNKSYIYISTLLVAIVSLATSGCKEDFLELTPTGALNPAILNNKEGLDALLLGTYSGLDGTFEDGGVTGFGWQNDHTNWLYGEVRADNALKGTSIGDQPNMNPIEQGNMTAENDFFRTLWASVYAGVSRANSVLLILMDTQGLTDEDASRITAEARFLRAHFHHLGRRYFGNLPYIDEITEDFRVPNSTDISSNIQADYEFAIANLPVDPLEAGRAHVSAAQASLAKLHLDNGDYAAAEPLLDDIINSGRYLLFPNYNDNFISATEDATTATERIFDIQSLGERRGGSGLDGRLVNGIAQLHGCCGFLNPSQSLVNAHKTDANGLPLLDTFNDVDLANDQGVATADPFTPPTDNLDPRVDWTVGRRGIPYLGFDINLIPGDPDLFPGQDFIVDQVTYGPYRAKKFIPDEAEVSAASGGSFLGASDKNYSIHRYADILLLRAETAVEAGDLSMALDLVNQVRDRAKNSEVVRFADGTPAANYTIEPYATFPDQVFARKAVRHERRLELALEGQRWFDLVRWGVAQETMMDYFATEDRPLLTEFGTFISDFLPIPGSEIDVTRDDAGNPTLTQNPGF